MVREKEGIRCKKCERTKHYWRQSHWQCSECTFRTTLKSGTMMEHSKIPFIKWNAAIAFMSFSKKGILATEIQRQLVHKWYLGGYSGKVDHLIPDQIDHLKLTV